MAFRLHKFDCYPAIRINQGLNTISGIVRSVGSSTDDNNTKAYASRMSRLRWELGLTIRFRRPMRPQLIAAMAAHENGVPLPAAATKVPQASPTGLLLQHQFNRQRHLPLLRWFHQQPASAAPAPLRNLLYAGTGPIPGGMLPAILSRKVHRDSLPGMAPMVSQRHCGPSNANTGNGNPA